jgi:hypothetical protein
MTETHQNCILEKIKSRLNSGNAVQNVLFSRLLFKYVKNKIHKNVLTAVSCECEGWSPMSRDERRLRIFEKRVPRRIFGPKRDKVTEG